MSELIRTKPLSPGHLSFAEHAYRQHNAMVDAGTTFEDILETPNYFAHVGPRLKYGDEIRLVALDGLWVGLVMVTHADGSVVRVVKIYETKIGEKDVATGPDDGLFVQLCGPKKFCIRNKETGQDIKEGIETKLDAERQLADYRKALGR